MFDVNIRRELREKTKGETRKQEKSSHNRCSGTDNVQITRCPFFGTELLSGN